MKTNYWNHLIVLLVFCGPSVLLGQNQEDESEGYRWFDQLIGAENSGLYDGVVYIEKYRMRNEKQKFFRSPDFLQGSISYNGQPYFDVEMKYDLYEDEILVRSSAILRLDKKGIDSFRIEEKKFVKIDNGDYHAMGVHGFFEILLETPGFTFFKKHRKKKTDRLGERLIYHEFTDENAYYLLHGRAYHIIGTKEDIIKVFPKFKKEIKARSKANRPLRKRDKGAYLSSLLDQVHELTSQENKTRAE